MVPIWRLFVAYIGPVENRGLWKTEIGTEVAHARHMWLEHHFQGQKVKGQLAGGGGILWRPPAQLVGDIGILYRVVSYARREWLHESPRPLARLQLSDTYIAALQLTTRHSTDW